MRLNANSETEASKYQMLKRKPVNSKFPSIDAPAKVVMSKLGMPPKAVAKKKAKNEIRKNPAA